MKKYFSKLLQTFSGCQRSVILNEAKNPIYPHKDSSPTVQNDATTHSGSLKAVRGILKRLPHSLRSFAMTDFYLSGSLKNAVILNEAKNPSYPHKDSSPVVQNDATTHSGSLKLVLAIIFSLFFNIAFAQTPDFANPQNYKPGGKYRMFGAGRGTVEKVRNTIKPTASTSSKAGPLRLDAQSYAGYVHYEQRFSNHPLSEHGPFVNDRVMEVGDFHGSIINGQAGVAKAKITGREWHPADAYDAADGGDHPYDSYYYYVHGSVHSVSVQPLELPKLPSFSNPFSKNSQNNQNNGLPEKNAATENDRTRDLTGSDNLPNSPNGQPESSDVANNGEVPLPQDVTKDKSNWTNDLADGFWGGLKELAAGARDYQADGAQYGVPVGAWGDGNQYAQPDPYAPSNYAEGVGANIAAISSIVGTKSPASLGRNAAKHADDVAKAAANAAKKVGEELNDTERAINAARQARDNLAKEKGRKHATYAAGEKDGKVVTGCSGGGKCAEDRIAEQLGSNANMTEAKGWRRNKQTGELEYVDIPVCKNCQSKYSKNQFPAGTKYEKGGAWDK